MGLMNRSRMRRVLTILAVSLGLAGAGVAQTLVGTVEGKIVDEQGAVLPGVTVTLTGP